MKEEEINLHFASDGVCIGDRKNRRAVTVGYGDMLRIVHEFLCELYRYPLITKDHGEVDFMHLKEGDASPYPVVVVEGKRNRRKTQLKPSEVVGIKNPLFGEEEVEDDKRN